MTIKILDHIDYDPDTIKPQNMEVTLVHEILHVVYDAVWKSTEAEADSLVGQEFEAAIERTAEALMELDRAK